MTEVDIDWAAVTLPSPDDPLPEGVVWAGARSLRPYIVPIEQLKPFPGNSRRGDVPRIAQSLNRFGQVRAVLVLPDWTIVAGHHVTKAAASLDWTHVAAIPADFDTRDDARDYLVTDNNLGQLGYIENKDQVTLLDEIEKRGSWEGTGFTAEDLADLRALSVHKTELMEAAKLKRHPDHYRKHDYDQIQEIVKSLEQHGFYRNIVVARDGTVLAGDGVLEAARQIGLSRVPITRLDIDPHDPEALKILAGDNELANMTTVNDRTLTELLKKVGTEDDLSGTGFDARSLAALLMVTRPAHEISTENEASHWVGLPEYDRDSNAIPCKLVVSFESEEQREAFMEHAGFQKQLHKRLTTWSVWWPERERADPGALNFVDSANPVDQESK